MALRSLRSTATIASLSLALLACGGDDGGGGMVKPPGPEIDGDSPIELTLHPNHSSVVGDATVVAFGVPFPRGAVESLDDLALVDSEDREISAHFEELLPWRTLDSANGGDGSIRAALIYAEVSFTEDAPMAARILRNAERTQTLEPLGSAAENWRAREENDYPDGLEEPLVYATFSAEYLGNCALRSYSLPVGAEGTWSWFDDFMIGAAKTMANEVHDGVGEEDMVDVLDNEPWLFDRPSSFFTVYFRTGDVHWLRHAHRAVRFYLSQLDSDGYFELAPGHPDLKYSFGASLLLDLILTGDRRLLDNIEAVARAGEDWDPVYEIDDNFWTERHQTYALTSALAAFEATGSGGHAARLKEVAAATFEGARNPADGGWPNDGCVLHTIRSHEGDSDDDPICSPWMSALLAEPVWRYYLQSEDEAALEYLGNLAQFIADHGTRMSDDVGYEVPWYLVSSVREYTDSGEWEDWEHSCDVAGIVARGLYARELLGESTSDVQSSFDKLLASCEGLLDNWHRPSSDSLPEWRITPSRKFNWWFGSTTDMAWVVREANK